MSLLPPNSSTLLRALEQTHNLEIDEAIKSLYAFKSNPKDNLLYWLIWEYGLESILPYSNDLRGIIKDGLIWQRIRGTPSSLNMAYRWLNLNDVVIEQDPPGRHFYEYQLNPSKIPGDVQLSKLIKISEMSAPARSKLARIHHNYDIRSLKLSNHEFGHYLSDYSGTYFQDCEDNNVKVSFARQYQHSGAYLGFSNQIKIKRKHSIHQSYYVTQRLGQYQLGTRLNEHQTASVAHVCLRSVSLNLQGQIWLGKWESQTWQKAGYVISSYYHNSQYPTPVQTHVVGAVRSLITPTFNQNRKHSTKVENISLARKVEYHQHRNFSVVVQLTNRTWLGDWSEEMWQSANYSIASVNHHTLS